MLDICYVTKITHTHKHIFTLFISVINQLDAQNFCFTISLFHIVSCTRRPPIGMMIPEAV